jgi:hypothetical protein
MGLRHSPESRSRGHPEITDYTSMCTFSRFEMKPSPSQKLVNSAQTSESHEITKVAALKEAQKSRNPRLARAKEKYKSQHERQDGIYPYRLQSTLHE